MRVRWQQRERSLARRDRLTTPQLKHPSKLQKEPETAKRVCRQIFREFMRMGGDAPIETMLELAPRLMPTVLDVAAKKVEPVTRDLLQKADRLDQEERQLMTTLAFLVTLPRTVRETPKFIQTTTVEDQLLKVDNPVEAVLLAFCLHWVADLCYQPGAKGFYTIVEHLLGLNATKLTGMALSTLSALKEKM
ncbi:hypothetical protein HPB48_009843 [Haemaphysalis longicornis]|uniref:Uncharacterized protein n=1 Tax=Haemaphysalis longicornis TaxID=44386 RepID=A0A9J6GT74_HAELO|nr:hypothetical protein HPB48_009843 [Haemaphysalis longicornis]